MSFRTLDAAISLIESLRPAIARIRQRDRKLAIQIVDATNSVALNLGEAQLSDPGNRRSRLHSAAGSASEVRAGIRAARAWGYLREPEVDGALRHLDGVVAQLWKLTR